MEAHVATEVATSQNVAEEKVGQQVQRYINRDKAIEIDAKKEANGKWTINAVIPKRP